MPFSSIALSKIELREVRMLWFNTPGRGVQPPTSPPRRASAEGGVVIERFLILYLSPSV